MRSRPRARAVRAVLVPFVILAVVLLGGCGGSGRGPGAGGGDRGATLTVSAAASLTDAFGEIARDFEREHPGVEVELNLDGSSALARQALEGAPVDVFASADELNVERLVDAGLVVGRPELFATGELAIVVRPGAAAAGGGVRDLTDLADLDGIVALCASEVPCGRLADEVLARVGVALPEGRTTRTANVRAALTSVTEGDAVAAITYATDAAAAGDAVDVVPIGGEVNVRTAYPIVVLDGATDRQLAEAFVAHVLSPRGQAVLGQLGFGAPA